MLSDSSVPVSPAKSGRIYPSSHITGSMLDSNFEKVWDGENCVRYVSKRSLVPEDTSSSPSPPPTSSWHPSIFSRHHLGDELRVSLRNNLQGNDDIMHNTLIPEDMTTEHEIEESASFSGSSSATSRTPPSSSASSSFASRNSTFEFQRVRFDSPAREAERNETKFDRIMRRVTSALEMPLYRESTTQQSQAKDDYEIKYPTFFCPNCKTHQRAFISVANAGGQFESPLGYLAVYFALYLVSSLFVFGLEEGWKPLDCVYFSVITLTTAGLGDFVPTSDGAKIACSCFIYFGVATIGLLLGSLLASSLDNETKQDAIDAQVRDCPNCQRLQKTRLRHAMQNATSHSNMNGETQGGAPKPYEDRGYEELGEASDRSSYSSSNGSSSNESMMHNNNGEEGQNNFGLDANEDSNYGIGMTTPVFGIEQKASMLPDIMSNSFETLRRQFHTRHMSFDASRGVNLFGNVGLSSLRKSAEYQTPVMSIDEKTPFLENNTRPPQYYGSEDKSASYHPDIRNFFDDSSSDVSSTDTSVIHPIKPMSRLKAAKYVILTLNQALANSLFIIAIGGFGFYFIEEMSAVDSFYFTTVLLTSVGYGDIVPVTSEGKLFATIYVIVAGTVLLHNMSLISMIPLELRKRRIEHAVLGQFGNQLTDDELRELSTGTLINRLKLATNRPDGLDECTREMFSLAMLVRLGKITENDVRSTFAAFRRLDVGNQGKLNSRTIIEGELLRRRAMHCRNLAAAAAMQQPMDPWEQQSHGSIYSTNSFAEYSHASNYTPQFAVPVSPNPFLKHVHYSNGSLVKRPSMDSRFSENVPLSSSFDFEAYESWARGWQYYDASQNQYENSAPPSF